MVLVPGVEVILCLGMANNDSYTAFFFNAIACFCIIRARVRVHQQPGHCPGMPRPAGTYA